MSKSLNDRLPANDPQAKWYIVRVRAGMEARVGEEIVALGQTVYAPAFRKEYKHARHRYWTTKHFRLLTGYVFVLASVHWNRLLGCEGVERILRSRLSSGELGDPIAIDEAVVKAIREKQEAGEFDEMRVHGRIAVGERVNISNGPMAGMKGNVISSTDDAVVMMLEMLGREVKATAPVAILTKAS